MDPELLRDGLLNQLNEPWKSKVGTSMGKLWYLVVVHALDLRVEQA
jgi:hypothetical protein